LKNLAIFIAFEDDMYDRASFYHNKKERDLFIEEQYEFNYKRRFNANSSFTLNFGTQKGQSLCDYFGDCTLPNIYSLELKGVSREPQNTEYFMRNNFPHAVDQLIIRDIPSQGIDFSKISFDQLFPIFNRIRKEIYFGGFKIQSEHLSLILNLSHHMNKINLWGWKLKCNEPIFLEGNFENLTDLELEEVGLSEAHIENIGKFLA